MLTARTLTRLLRVLPHALNPFRHTHTHTRARGRTHAGPGAQGFYQSDIHRGASRSLYTPLSVLINSAAQATPSAQQRACQGVKPILLNVGEATTPYPWVPRVTGVTLVRLGSFVSGWALSAAAVGWGRGRG
jgi:hypothetical protein